MYEWLRSLFGSNASQDYAVKQSDAPSAGGAPVNWGLIGAGLWDIGNAMGGSGRPSARSLPELNLNRGRFAVHPIQAPPAQPLMRPRHQYEPFDTTSIARLLGGH